MKRNLFILVCAAMALVACNKNEKEPTFAQQQEVIPGEEITLKFGMPQVNSSKAHARTVHGSMDNQDSGIAFYWDENDPIRIYSLKEDGITTVNCSKFTMTSLDKLSNRAEFKGVVPTGGEIDEYLVVYGPDEISTSQPCNLNAVGSNIMRFEVKGKLTTELTLKPVWSILVVNPYFYYSFSDKLTNLGSSKTVITYLYQQSMSLDIEYTDGKAKLPIKCDFLKHPDGMLLYTSMGPANFTASLPIVVYPTNEGYKLTISLQFDKEHSKGFVYKITETGLVKDDSSEFLAQMKSPIYDEQTHGFPLIALDTPLKVTEEVGKDGGDNIVPGTVLAAGYFTNVTLPDICISWDGGKFVDR